MPPTDRRPDAFQLAREWRFILATFAATGVGYLGSNVGPVIVQALIDSGMRHQQAGDLGTIELLTLAICTTLVAPVVPRVSHRKLAVGGALIAALGAAISAMSESYAAMILGRIVIGAGSGLAIAGANAAVSAREDAERIFAIIWTLGGGITVGIAVFLPLVVAGGAYGMGYCVLLLLCIAALPLVLWLPAKPQSFGTDASTPSTLASDEVPGAVGEVRDRLSQGRAGPFGSLALLTLVGIFIYSIAEQALWQFSYDIAVDHGIAYNTVRYVLGVATFAGLTGGALAAWLGLRWRRVAPLVIGCLISLAGRWLYIEATAIETLVAATLLWGVGFYFVGPYQIGLAAALDRRGRVAVAAAAAVNLGYGLGPTLGGRVRQYQVDHGLDSGLLVAVIAGATALSLLFLLPAALRLERGAGSGA
ncbi:MAG: MFS transporter [Deltaproteobacteria bacterium]|jgi:MFS family permease|nr:MFS transporter [Deltaproteobacteria bacterium]